MLGSVIVTGHFEDQPPPDGAALVLVDPPYGIGKRYAEGREAVPYADWVQGLLSWWAQSNCPRIMLLAPTPTIWEWMPQIPCPDRFVWWHRTFLMARRKVTFWSPSLTPVLVYESGDVPWYGSTRQDRRWHDVIDCVNMMGDVQRLKKVFPAGTPFKHPAATGTAIATKLIEPTTASGDLVIDPMCGFGSILVAANRLGRSALGIEVVPEYAEAGRKWLEYEASISDA